MNTNKKTIKTNKRNKRSKEELRIHRETMKNYFIVNHHQKIEFKDIKRDLYKNLNINERTIRNDLKAIKVSAFNSKFYKLDKMDEIEKCINSLHDILQKITLHSPLIDAKTLNYSAKYPELETTNLFMVLITSNSHQALLDFQNYLKLYFKLIEVNFEEKFFEIQNSPRFIKFYLTLRDDCDTLVDMLYYFKHTPLKEIRTSPEIKTFLDEDITKTLKKLCSSKSNESSEKNTD